MTYLEKWLDEKVWNIEGVDTVTFSQESLLRFFTDCHEDLELELNRAQSELKRSKEISKRQGEITAINMEDFIELTDEFREANAAIREFVAQRGKLLCHEDGMITELYEKAIDRALKES